MKADSVKLANGVYWVGALDWDARDFHGFVVPGMTYNAYLLFGEEKTTLIDTVDYGFFPEFWARIEDAFAKEGLDEVKIDILIQNHIENDHIGGIADLVEKIPDIEIYCTKNASDNLPLQIPVLEGREFNVISTGDVLDIGGKSFTFVNAPMLHWPDSNFTLYNEEGILFSNDAFGQHVCEGKRFDVDVDEGYLKLHAKRFYANLVALSSRIVVRKVNEMADAGYLDKVEMIAPCHGQIWTNPQVIIDLYAKWATGDADDKITVIYDTMHHSTQKMAHSIVEGIMSEGVDVKVAYLKYDNESDIISEVLDSKAIIFGAPTMMNNPFPNVGKIMYYFDCLKFGNCGVSKKAAVFGSSGWAGGAIKKITQALQDAKFDVLEDEAVESKFVPKDDVIDQCYELGKKMAKIVKEE